MFVLKRFCIFYLVSLVLVRTYANRLMSLFRLGAQIIFDFLWVPDIGLGAQKLVTDSFCSATYGCRERRALHSMPTSSTTIRISEEVRTSTK